MKNNKTLDLDKEILLFKYHKKKTSDEESLLVEQWLEESSEFREESAIVEQVVTLDSQLKESRAFGSTEVFESINNKIENNYNKQRIIKYLYRAAAILIIPLLISSFTFGYLFGGKTQEIVESIQYMEVASSPGLITRVELPDQSLVCLNAGSTLRYPVSFTGNKREVELSGEAYFEVQSDKENPFYVTTQEGVKIMAYGTAFNVSTYNDDEEIQAVLVEGKVDVQSDNKNIMKLRPGEQIIFNKKTKAYTVENVNIYEHTAWKDGKMVFRDTHLDDVFKALGRKYNVEIHFLNKDKEKNYNCWATFTDETIYQILSYLKQAAPIRWKLHEIKQNSDSTLAKQRIDIWYE